MNDLEGMLKRLHLPTVHRLYPELALRRQTCQRYVTRTPLT